jgi:hypothetical protein
LFLLIRPSNTVKRHRRLWVSEEGIDAFWSAVQFIHVLLGGGLQFGFGSHGHLGSNRVFQTAIQALVWIQFRRLTGQIENFDISRMLFQLG